MKTNMRLKRILAGLACAGALALSANAQAAIFHLGEFVPGNGDVGNPKIVGEMNLEPHVSLRNPPANDSVNYRIYFDLGNFTEFNMTSEANGFHAQVPFDAGIFSNLDGSQIGTFSTSHLSIFLPDLGLTEDYYLGLRGYGFEENRSYQVTMWGAAPAPVPLPAAVWLFGSGVIGLVGLARRKMKMSAAA